MPRPVAFTAKQVTTLTGLPPWTLDYWEKTEVYEAVFIDERKHVPYRRIYDFRDLVSLRTLAKLRHEHGVPLDELRKAGRYLRETQPDVENPWTEMRFGVLNRKVVFRDPVTGGWQTAQGQQVLPIDIWPIAKQAERDAQKLMRRKDEDLGVIVRHRHILRNAWRIAGTRIPTSAVWAFHESGASVEEIRREYPDLRESDVVAAISHERQQRGLIAA
jgi:uncharacterized protein (DUF433 family)